MSFRAWVAGLFACASLSATATARPFTVDDLLRQEAFGDITLDPTGMRLVIERRGPYDEAGAYGYGQQNGLAASRLLIADLAHGGLPEPLMPQPDGCGYLAGPWAPDGQRLAVYRLCGMSWELGVAEVAGRTVRWLGVTPASDATGRSVQWRSPTTLLVIARPPDDPPRELRAASQSAIQLPRRWAATADGAGAHTLVGSGAFLQATARPAAAQLLAVDVTTGTEAALRQGDFVDLELSPSRRYLALLETGARLQPTSGRSPQGPWGVASEAHHLAILDLETLEITRPSPSLDLLTTLLSWAPASDRLLVFGRVPGAPWTDGAPRLYDARDRRLRPLHAGGLVPALRWRPEALATAWVDDQPVMQARATGQTRLDWWRLSAGPPVNLTGGLQEAPSAAVADGACLAVIADARLWRVDAHGKAAALSTAPTTTLVPPRRRASERLTFAVGALGAGVRAPVAFDRRRLLFADGRVASESPGRDEAILAFSAPLGTLVTLHTSPQGVGQLVVHKPGGPAQVLTSVNEDWRNVDELRPRPIRHQAADGTPLTSWLYLPTNPRLRPPPLIVRPYLGDNYRTAPASKPPVLGLAADVRVMVGQGYAVLLPSLPLPMSAREPLAGLGRQVLDIVDAAARQAPGGFDPSALALWGHSYGGYTALGVAAQTDRFRAVIALNAPTDLVSLYGVFQPSWRVSPENGVWAAWSAGFAEDSQGRMGAPPWEAADRYIRNSPVFLANKINAPVLLIQGDQDPIPVSQAEEMFSALYRQGKDAEEVTYCGEGHIISSPGNVRDLYVRAFAFLATRVASAAPTK
jgi:dipeptidyl aminopeptidase/acylaminoacyl peptidase